MNKKMKRIEHGAGGDVEVLHLVDAEIPVAGAGEVLIKVAYAGVNRPDVLQRKGLYPPPKDASPYLGLEVSGEVVALGAGVSQWKVGDKVCALVPGAGYAEYCVTDARHCMPVPAGLSMLQAAALPETYLTVWTNVFERGALKAGETFLVHGGSSGIGLTAIQLAKAFGARVFTTVGNAEKAEVCRAQGADIAINYRDEDFSEVVQQQTDGQGVELILDMVGGDYITKNVASLALEGRLVQIAFLLGSRVDMDLMPIMLKRLTVTGSTLRARSSEQKAALVNNLVNAVWPLLEAGKCLPVIHAEYTLSDVQAAHRLMESSQHIGKIMLKVEE